MMATVIVAEKQLLRLVEGTKTMKEVEQIKEYNLHEGTKTESEEKGVLVTSL
jgi:hypothetical protein